MPQRLFDTSPPLPIYEHPDTASNFCNMAYDNFNPMLQQARKYSILSCCLKGTKTIDSPSHFVFATEARSQSSWAGSYKTHSELWCSSIG
jgi:hypothetical protein